MDISDFSQTFFDEADELLADMEQHLLALDPSNPDSEQLNAIFRAAHSIKGGAGTFGFSILQETTHILENILDNARRGELSLTSQLIDLFLETKDIMQDQLNAYKSSAQPDEETFQHICEMLRKIALNQPPKAEEETAVSEGGEAEYSPQAEQTVRIKLSRLKSTEIELLLQEINHLGTVTLLEQDAQSLDLQVNGVSREALIAVLCFIINEDQISFPEIETSQSLPSEETSTKTVSPPPPQAPLPANKPAVAATKAPDSGSIRVAVEKVDQLINLVGELVITQSMLLQHVSQLEPTLHGALFNTVNQLERNARDLQESVMSIRMMPMEYVFSRFPRLVRDLAAKLGKKVELTLQGGSTELDKSLIERIIDPLTHLVRNSLDHGVESAEKRCAAGKSAEGNLVLSAEHRGGSICIEVTDDGAGLDLERIYQKALSSGIAVHDSMSPEEIAQLIFAPGFSTAEQVTDVSGRGVGMDVVKRNIQDMGGHVEIATQPGKGTTIRILLPLTLAILDGMSVKSGNEVFIVPVNAVMESLQPRKTELKYLAGGERVLEVRGEYLPLISLAKIFDINDAREDPTEGIVIILQNAGKRFALLVDYLMGQHQVVVKNLESNYRRVQGISAATIMGDGSVAFIVDVPVLQAVNREKISSQSEN
ncbi:CheA signal transduction histidine kinase [Rosenbergiella nectarea]|uniref:Chemotaxis protein CheA n=1 Tax=Rosenbergiella nectarea TaxID=988801 RepID=A0A1H9HXG4_9GAMM|nr:chemotaxis protein CheA [Rosenbergiella nectarea]SEQ67021.1 CheA signal transduction histidine kinase [Rosenbergiella nectarea]